MTSLHFRRLSFAALLLCLLFAGQAGAEPKTVRLLTIGNSFAENAMTYFPRLAEAAGHQIIYGAANLGGCTLERHWRHVTQHEADPEGDEGSPYKGGRALAELLVQEDWDFITIQQASPISHDLSTYYPFAKDLVSYIRERAPNAEITIHQTWAYRVDDQRFTTSKKDDLPDTQQKMFEQVRKAYHSVAEDLGLSLAPCGDAMFLGDTDPEWGYQPDAEFDFTTAIEPQLPKQLHSLHTGWQWNRKRNDDKSVPRRLGLDGHHASEAGKYLLGCVWFETFFEERVVENSFVPRGFDPVYAEFLRETAHRAVAELKAEPKAAVSQ